MEKTQKCGYDAFLDSRKKYCLLKMRREYVEEEVEILRNELARAKEEINRAKSVPLLVGQFLEAIDNETAIISSTAGSNSVVKILSTVDREMLIPNTSVALHRHSSAIVDVLPPDTDMSMSAMAENERPDVTFADIGGLEVQKQEIIEAIEMPLKDNDLYLAIGIKPPRGVLLYGPPGQGKTMLAQAVANRTKTPFFHQNGSEFIQKYLGEGPRMVRELFRQAAQAAPSIIFIDEVDAIGSKRFDASTSADREVQRVLMELLNQMDGFDENKNVKVIMATNRPDTIDAALLRPGRLDRKIEFNAPDQRQKRLIMAAITSKMNLDPSVDLEEFVKRPDTLSGAEINCICQEAGMLAVRNNRYIIMQKDFQMAYSKVIGRKDCGLLLYK